MAEGMCSNYNGSYNPGSDWPNGPYIGTGYVTSGGIVQAVQQMAEAYPGCSLGPSGADGYYGTYTQNAIICLQNYEGITADGIVGPQTWGALASHLNGGTGGGSQYDYTFTGPNTATVTFTQWIGTSSANVSCPYGGGEWSYGNPSGATYWMESTFTAF